MAFVLAGCSSGGSVATGSLVQTVGGAFHGIGTPDITMTDVKAVPFASIGYSVGDNSIQMLVLAGKDDGAEIWTSSAKVTLVTRGGRIVRSVGLQHDLHNLDATNGADYVAGTGSVRSVSFDEPDEPDGSLSCIVEAPTPERITVLDRDLNTLRVQERCESEQLRWKFVNNYWLDARNQTMLRSVQYIHPKLKPVTIEILRPAL